MIQTYLDFCKNARNFSATSLRCYKDIVRQWEKFCELQGLQMEHATADDALRWVMWQTSQSVKAVTINNRIVIVRSFYDFACRFGGWPVNPFVSIQRLKVPKLLPDCIPPEMVRKAIALHVGCDFYPTRARAIVYFLFCTGLRRAELLNLRLQDVDDMSKVIHVFGKGRKERLVPLPDSLLPYLQEWLFVRCDTIPRACEYFFCSSTGRQMSETSLYRVIHDVFKDIVAKELQHPHALRHSFATHCMQNGLPIPDIARLLGHSSTSTTLRYLSLSNASHYSSFINSIF